MRGAAFLALGLLFSPRPACAQDQAAIEWAEKHFQGAFDHAFPIPGDSTAVFVRAYHDLHHSFPEFSITLAFEARTSVLTLTVSEASNESLFVQLQRLYGEHHTDPIEKVMSLVQTRTVSASSANCPAVESVRRDFESLRLAPPAIYEIVLHPVVYQVRASGGGTLAYDIVGKTTEISRWSKAAIKAAKRCGAGSR